MRSGTKTLVSGCIAIAVMVGGVLLFRPAQQPTEHSADIALRLLGSLNERRNWPIETVKFNKGRPDLNRTLQRDKEALRVDGWLPHSNDYGAPMLRLNGGAILFEVTLDEFEMLRRLN